MRDVRVTIPAKRRNKLLLNKSPFLGNVKLAYYPIYVGDLKVCARLWGQRGGWHIWGSKGVFWEPMGDIVIVLITGIRM
jgi:hypothetical protein